MSLELNPTVRALNRKLSDGSLSKEHYARRLKRLYDTSASTLNVESIKFMESKFEEYGINYDNPEATDGVIKQAISGLIEGFTTFGIADAPDTPTEKMVNNVAHLVGLAPGVVLGGMGMITSATKAVGNNLIRKGTAAGSKSLINRGKRIVSQGKKYQGRSARARKGLSNLASKMTLRNKEGKDIIGFGKVTGKDLMGNPFYDLKSVPGKLADIVQSQAIKALGDNKEGAMKWLTQGLLRNKFSRERVAGIINESAHVGLLMAFSQHPLATRNEEGIKQMAMAGVHGAMAGGIFGSIGQYANISKLINSGNPALVRAGENIIRQTSKRLAQPTSIEVENIIDTAMKVTAGGAYGAITSGINKLPPEEFVYETLMGVFFSVNGRPAFKNRATRDILDKSKMLPDKPDKMGWLEKQQWFQDESVEYQSYWKRHVESIRLEQETNQNILKHMALKTAQMQKFALDNKLITIDQIKEIRKEKNEQEGMYAVMDHIRNQINKAYDPDYSEPALPGAYEALRKETGFLSIETLTDQMALETFVSPKNEIDFPLNSVKRLSEKIYKSYKKQPKVQQSKFEEGLNNIWLDKNVQKHLSGDKPKVEPAVKEFISQVKSTFKNHFKTKRLDAKEDIRELRRVAVNFATAKNKKNSHTVSLTRGEKGEVVSVDYYPTPKEYDGMPVNVQTMGNRAMAKYEGQFSNYHIETIDYLEGRVKEPQVSQEGVQTQRTVNKLLSPDAEIDFNGKRQPLFDPKAWEMIETKLHTEGKFIFGTISDTGRKDVRKFLWSNDKSAPNYLSTGMVKSLAKDVIKEMDKKNENGLTGWELNGIVRPVVDANKDMTLRKARPIVGTLLYRMISNNVIQKESDINAGFLKDRSNWLRHYNAEKFVTANKMQKYLNSLDKLEVPGSEEVLGPDKIRMAVLEQSPVGRKGYGESGDDGLFIFHSKDWDAMANFTGTKEGAGTAKGTIFSPADGIRGDLIGKMQIKRGSESDDAYMEANNIRGIFNVTSAKDHAAVTALPLGQKKINQYVTKSEYPVLSKDYDPTKGIVEISPNELHWNQNVYEHIPDVVKTKRQGGKGTDAKPREHEQNIMQEILLNANTIQFDPSTPVGAAYWKSWRKIISDNVKGDPKENAYLEKQLENNKPLREDLSLDSLGIKEIDKVLSNENIKTKTAESIMEKLHTAGKSKLMVDMERDGMEDYANLLVGQYMSDVNFNHLALGMRGTHQFTQKILRNYILGRVFRPKTKYGYHNVLGEYSFKINQEKQKWSSAKKGLADNEYMLQEGAENRMFLKILGEEVSLGEWWVDFKALSDRNSAQSRWSNAKKEAYIEAQWHLLGRSPILTSGNVRALKFVGFVRGEGGKGTAIIANEYNDAYMSGADKDIDSAHVYLGMPRGLVEGYKQEHVQNESQKGQKAEGETLNIKDDATVLAIAGAKKGIETAGPVGEVQNILSQLFLGHKLNIARNMHYGKSSVGPIHNALYELKVSMDLEAQKSGKPGEWFERFHDLLNKNINVSNAYIDAADYVEIKPYNEAIKTLTELMSNEGVQKNEVLSQFKKSVVKGILPADKSYKDIAEATLKEYGKGEGILKIAAEIVSDLDMKISPWSGYSKENLYWLNRKLMATIVKDPLSDYFGIKDSVRDFQGDRLETEVEHQNIMNQPHFLFNKLHPALIAFGLKKSNAFIDKHSKSTDLGLDRSQLELFVREILHTAKKQKDQSINNKLNIDPDRMTYNQQIYASKQFLDAEIERYIYERGKQVGTITDQSVKEIKKDIKDLFDVWHQAFPFVELDYTANNKKTQSLKKRAAVYTKQANKVARMVEVQKKNPLMWGQKEEAEYFKEKQKLGAYELEAMSLDQVGQGNMQRSSQISKELRLEAMKWLEGYVKLADTGMGATAREMLLEVDIMKEADIKRKVDIEMAPGEIVPTVIEKEGRFTPEELVPWGKQIEVGKTLETAKDLSDYISTLEKDLKPFKLKNEEVISELDRYESNIKKLLMAPNKSLAFRISEYYTGVFQKLNTVAKEGIYEADYTHLRILNNMIENMKIETWKEWVVRKTTHEKLIKEWKDLGLDPEGKMLPPDWSTDVAFPTELGKLMAKYESVFKVERVQFVDPKDGMWKEYGSRMPASTIEYIGETIGKKHDAGNALGKAYENQWNSLLASIRPDNEADYTKYKNRLFAAAAMERQLGLKGNAEWDGIEGPRGPKEHDQSKLNLGAKLEKARKELNEIPEDVKFLIKTTNPTTKKPVVTKLSPREMVEKIKEDLFAPFFDQIYDQTFKSNWGALEDLILRNPSFAQDFNYGKFYNKNENLVTELISGMQSGADIGGAWSGYRAGIPTSGTVTYDFISEYTKGMKKADIASLEKRLKIRRDGNKKGSAAQRLKRRTIKNIKDANATIAFRVEKPKPGKRSGTDLTIGYARHGIWQDGYTGPGVFEANPNNRSTRPILVLDNTRNSKSNVNKIVKFIKEHPGSLNIAGTRESNAPGLEGRVKTLLDAAFKQTKKPHRHLDPSHERYWETRLANVLLTEKGLINFNKLRFISEFNISNKKLQAGNRVIERDFHEEDLAWVHRQIDIYENTLSFLKAKEKETGKKYIKKVGTQYDINWVGLNGKDIFNDQFWTDAQMLQRRIRRLNEEYPGSPAIGQIRERYWPLMGQDSTKAGVDYIKDVHIPQEIKRIRNLPLKELKDEDIYIGDKLERKLIKKKDAQDLLIANMVNKLLKDPARFQNELFYEQIEEVLNSFTTRELDLESVGAYTQTHGRQRAKIPVDNYLLTDAVPRKYSARAARGVTQGMAALQSRLSLISFRENARFNPSMGEAEAKAWLLKLIDTSRNYMGYPTTRNINLHGITKADQALLKDWASTGFDPMYSRRKKLGPVEVKLFQDFIRNTRLRREEISIIENKHDLEMKQKFKKASLDVQTAIDSLKTTKAKGKDKEIEKAKVLKDLQEKKGKLSSALIETRNKNIKKEIEDAELDLRIEGLKDENIDKMRIQKSFRSFYSDETIGNVALRIDNAANKLMGFDVNNAIPFLTKLPEMSDPAARHKAWVARLNWLSDMEGKFEMLSLLSHPKSGMANAYGGSTNLIVDVGFQHFFDSFKSKELVAKHFKGKKYEYYNEETRRWEQREIETIDHVHEYFQNYGMLDNNIRDELIQYTPPGVKDYRGFVNEVSKNINDFFKKNSIYTGGPAKNKANQKKRDDYTQLTLGEAADAYGVSKDIVNKGSFFMRKTEQALRLKTAIANYLKAKEIFTDGQGTMEVREDFLLEYAKRGIAASQFIYHATNRPNFANTAFGRMMTRFHPYGWNSVRRRADLIKGVMMTEGHKDFDVTKRFERQMTSDMMQSALAVVFASSIFEYALSPPMNWFQDFSMLMFGEEKERERAFYNQYGHPLLAPLGIITPPGARFILPPVVSIINNDYETLKNITAPTWAPFGRVTRDALRTLHTPEMAGEWMFGLPVHKFGQMVRRNQTSETNLEENVEDEE